ncbi:sporadically distributed protein, TIGR04141 family [Dyella sp. 333MFSha]|nr:sporadically distributed protein, TIGR04141 family [Dyella sp. 333MFSha]
MHSLRGSGVNTYTIYLMRDSVQSAKDAVIDGAETHTIADGMSQYGVLFVKPTYADSPKWADLFAPYVEKERLGKVQSSSSVFMVCVNERWFAITFGQGRFLLHPDRYEERFGLIVTINSIAPDALRSVDKRRFVDDQNSRVQTNQASAVLSFGVDIERDLIRGLVGQPLDEDLGRRMAGADALTVVTTANIADLPGLLCRYLQQFGSKAYQENFPWVDQVRQLDARGHQATELDNALVEKLSKAWAAGAEVDDCWMAMPDIVDWATVDGFKFNLSKRAGVLPDLRLADAMRAFAGEVPSLEFLRSHYAFAVDADERALERWPLYRCLHCELKSDEGSFVLSAGRWFRVDTNFVQSVDAAVAQIPAYEKAFPVYRHKNEGDYNEEVAEADPARWALMDQKLLHVGGVHGRIEFCDLYGQGELIHVKRYGSSAVLGHCFNQGLVSGELLHSSEAYFDLANEKLADAHQLCCEGASTKVPRTLADYRVVFAIIDARERPGVRLPFFAKVVLKTVTARLLERGFKSVSLAKIDADAQEAVVERLPYRPPRRRRSSARLGQ